MCASPQVLYKRRLPCYSNEGCVFIPKPFFPYKAESWQSHPSSLSALAMPIQGSPALKVQTGQSPRMTLCLKVLLQVMRIRAVAVAQEETRGCLLTPWDEWVERTVGTSL